MLLAYNYADLRCHVTDIRLSVRWSVCPLSAVDQRTWDETSTVWSSVSNVHVCCLECCCSVRARLRPAPCSCETSLINNKSTTATKRNGMGFVDNLLFKISSVCVILFFSFVNSCGLISAPRVLVGCDSETTLFPGPISCVLSMTSDLC